MAAAVATGAAAATSVLKTSIIVGPRRRLILSCCSPSLAAVSTSAASAAASSSHSSSSSPCSSSSSSSLLSSLSSPSPSSCSLGLGSRLRRSRRVEATWVQQQQQRSWAASASPSSSSTSTSSSVPMSGATVSTASGSQPDEAANFSTQKFTDFELDRRLLMGIDTTLSETSQPYLTKVQEVVFKELLRSASLPVSDASLPQPRTQSDLLLKAHTGTGKTMAFLIPTLQNLFEQEKEGTLPAGVAVLVLAPTRELALQISRVAQALLQADSHGSVRSSFVISGFSRQEDLARLKADAPHVLVATPGRLVQHLQATPNFVRALGRVQHVVVDEADRLIEESTFMNQLDYIYRCLPETPRPCTWLVSATFSASVRRFAARCLRAGLRTLDAVPSGQDKVAPLVEQLVMTYKAAAFLPVLHATIQTELGAADEGDRRVLVLLPTIRSVQFLYVMLKHRLGMKGVYALHRDLAPEKRRARAALFSRGAPPIRGVLLATNLAMRGLDFDVHTVIQVGSEGGREEYIHRAGRTGRLTQAGRSLLMLNEKEQLVKLALGELQLQDTPAPEVGVEEVPAALAGWWEDPALAASGNLFFGSILSYYLQHRAVFRLQAQEVVELAAAIYNSTGYPEELGLPPVRAHLAAQLKEQDELLNLRSASVRERWDWLASLPAKPGKPRRLREQHRDRGRDRE